MAPKTFGISVNGMAEAGAGPWGGTVATGSLGGALPLGNGSPAGIGSGGIASNAGNYAGGAPQQSPNESGTYGAYIGGGVMISVSNGTPCQLQGPFKVINFDIGIGGLNGGASIAFNDDGVFQLTITPPLVSDGYGAAMSFLHTNTLVKPIGCTCQ